MLSPKQEKQPEKDQNILDIIEQIWPIYDVDCSGDLDKDETREFITQFMQAVGFDGDDNFQEDDVFDEMFKEFDADGSGNIEKEEMYDFIAKLTGKT